MENTRLKRIADSFTEKEKPIVIFCDWNDALEIKKEVDDAIKKSTYGQFTKETELSKFNAYSVQFEGKTFLFVDQMQMKEILTFL